MLLMSVAAFNVVSAQSTSTPAVKDFDGISLGGPFNAIVKLGNEEKVKIEASSEDLSQIVTEVNDRMLTIKWKNSSKMWKSPSQKITIYITAKKLNDLTVSGSGNLKVEDQLNAEDMDIVVSGSGNLSTQINAKSLNSKISGSGSIDISGSAARAEVYISGSGNFKGSSLKTKSTTAKVSGSGEVRIQTDEELDAAVTGSGNVIYSGSATKISAKTSGSGKIKKVS
ncbi:Protein of unknown function (DUF2807) [Solitalea canadensis DSM 3403]|uniref:Putative auto-transporter adhesin head GIN domain-containing protein n=2 Tax=Solitalea canadensis TaxID=995 RepID=H8KXQ6_SOLCM|nr:Protein of unknown function (DUF2807) [Solitalea canadensis DSM 3403]